jgi:hypothetical protein
MSVAGELGGIANVTVLELLEAAPADLVKLEQPTSKRPIETSPIAACRALVVNSFLDVIMLSPYLCHLAEWLSQI